MPFQVQTQTVGGEIDDAIASTSKTYSSSKIVSELDKQISEPLPKLSSNNNKYLKYVHGSSPIWDTPSGGGSGSSTYLGLTDTPSSYNNNSLLYSTASGIAHTSTQIAIDGNGVEVNQLNARENNVSNIGDSSHKFNNVFCGNIHQGNVKLVIPSTRGSSGQYIKVNNATGETHTLEFFDILDDTTANNNTTYSSNKINTELATKSNTSHNHDDRYYTESESDNLLNGKIDKTSIQTLAEGNSTSETDIYSCNSVYSKNEINTSINTEQFTLNNTSSTGILNFGSNQATGNYANLQTYANGTRYSTQQWSNASGTANVDWYFMKANTLTKTINIRPNDRNQAFEVITGGIKGETLSMRDGYITCRIGNYGNSSAGRYGIVITPLINTIESQIELRGLRNTGILSDLYTNHLSGSTLTLQSRLVTNRHSANFSNIEVSTYQNGLETKVLDIGSNGTSKTITITGTTHGTGHFTTDQNNFTANDQLVTKEYVDTRLPTDVNTPVSYSIQNAVTDQNYVFGIEPTSNVMGLVEVPKIYTGVPASSRGVRVGFNGGDYGSGAIAVGYEALLDSTGSAGQTNAIRSVAIGYQAGYHSEAANHGIYIGPYQGYQLSTSNQLRIGNSGVSPTTTGYDKAIIEGTMGTTDASQIVRLNADTIYLGSSLPTSQPADNRLWLSNGNLSIGSTSGGGGGGGNTFTNLTDTPSSYTANRFLKSTSSALDWFDLTSKTLTWDFYNALGDLPSASTNHGQIAHVHAEAAVYYAHNGSWVKLANSSDLPSIQTSYQPSPTAGMVYAASLLNNHIVPMAAVPTQNNYLLASNGGAFTWTNVIQSAYQASPAATMVYDCSYLNPRVLPTISSGTNQYVLGNDGTSATWLSTLQVGTSTMNIGTSTVKKFATWAGSTFLEYFMKTTPSNGDTLGSVVFSDTSLNNYATFSGKVDNNSTRAGHFSFSTAWNNSIVETLLVGKSDHSGSDAGQFKGVLKADGIKFSGNTTQTKPVEDPSTVGHVLTATSGGNWQWAAAAGGSGPSWSNVDVSSLSFAANIGVGRGDRRGTWMIEDANFFFVENLTRMTNQLMNGLGHAQASTANDNNYHVRNFGFWVAYPVANVAYNFTKMYINAYDVTQTPTNFIVEGSNDKNVWTVLHTCTGTHTVTGSPYNYTSGSQHATYEYALSTGSNYYHYWRLRMTNTGYPGNGNSTTQTYQYWSLREVMFS
jgi:hypothetical protein